MTENPKPSFQDFTESFIAWLEETYSRPLDITPPLYVPSSLYEMACKVLPGHEIRRMEGWGKGQCNPKIEEMDLGTAARKLAREAAREALEESELRDIGLRGLEVDEVYVDEMTEAGLLAVEEAEARRRGPDWSPDPMEGVSPSDREYVEGAAIGQMFGNSVGPSPSVEARTGERAKGEDRHYLDSRTTEDDVLHLKTWIKDGEYYFQIAQQRKTGEFLDLRDRAGNPSDEETFAPCSRYYFVFQKNRRGPQFSVGPETRPPTIMKFALYDTDTPYRDLTMWCPKPIWPYFLEAVVMLNRALKHREQASQARQTPDEGIDAKALISLVNGFVAGMKARLDGQDSRLRSVETEISKMHVALLDRFKNYEQGLHAVAKRIDGLVERVDRIKEDVERALEQQRQDAEKFKYLSREFQHLEKIIKQLYGNPSGILQVMDPKEPMFIPPGIEVEFRQWSGRPVLIFTDRFLIPPRVNDVVVHNGESHAIESVVWDSSAKIIAYVTYNGEYQKPDAG